MKRTILQMFTFNHTTYQIYHSIQNYPYVLISRCLMIHVLQPKFLCQEIKTKHWQRWCIILCTPSLTACLQILRLFAFRMRIKQPPTFLFHLELLFLFNQCFKTPRTYLTQFFFTENLCLNYFSRLSKVYTTHIWFP